jgi:hypothetical protein
MWFRLALAWGCTVPEAQARCNSNELTEWMAFSRLEPWGGEAEDLRWSLLLAMFINAHRGKHTRRFTAADFQMGDHTKPVASKHERWAAIKTIFRSLKPPKDSDAVSR